MTKPILIVLCLIAIFTVAAFFIPADGMTQILSGGILIAAIVGVWRWGGAAVRVFVRGARNEESWGILGIVTLLGAIIASRVYSIIYIGLDRPEAFLTLYINPFIQYSTLIALSLFIVATRFSDERPNKLGSGLTALIAFFGVLLTAGGPLFVKSISAFIASVLKMLAVLH